MVVPVVTTSCCLKDDQFILTKKQLFEQIVGLMGGRAGEEATIGDNQPVLQTTLNKLHLLLIAWLLTRMTDSLGMVELEKRRAKPILTALSRIVKQLQLKLMKL